MRYKYVHNLHLLACPKMVLVWVIPGSHVHWSRVLLPAGVKPDTSSSRTAVVAVDGCRSSMPYGGRLPCNSRPGSEVGDPLTLPSYSDSCRFALRLRSATGTFTIGIFMPASESRVGPGCTYREEQAPGGLPQVLRQDVALGRTMCC